MDNSIPVFTKEMKKTHTILLPMMLPIHFSFMEQILRQHGYKTALLQTDHRGIVNEGLKNVHNDTCYPALLVIGQLIDALKHGGYDPNRTALMITQTGGGCRASNYIFLLRKALKKSGFSQVPVISLNMNGLDSSPGFRLTPSMLLKFAHAIFLGDLLMLLENQCRPYEETPGATQALVAKWQEQLCALWRDHKFVPFRRLSALFPQILRDFAALPKRAEARVRVGIVGEIYMKYSPMGNNHLVDFLVDEGAEAVVPGLADFCMYCICNSMQDRELYGGKLFRAFGAKRIYHYFLKKERTLIEAIEKDGHFRPPTLFSRTYDMAQEYIGRGVKMGEGWLLTVEMAELIEAGVCNIVCTQPFGCLPNHIVAKGMMNAIKARHPEANIVPIDYDPGASETNQQNRIKMMLATAEKEAAHADVF